MKSLSLFHHVAPPKRGGNERPPVLLLLHGFGAHEDDLFSLAPYVDERFLVISPRAPVALGYGSHAWFPLGFTPQGIVIDPQTIAAARQALRDFVVEVVAEYSVDERAVFLMGFSQGAMMSLDLALREPARLAGVVAMSGRLMPNALEQRATDDELTGLPVLITHGVNDPIIPVSQGRTARDQLQTLPITLEYHEYPMAHEISPASLRDITAWLARQLSQFTVHSATPQP